MARPRRKLDTHGQAEELLEKLKKEPAGWRKERLLCLKQAMEGEKSNQQIADGLGVSYNTVMNWCKAYREGGIEKLLSKDKGNGPPPALNEEQMECFKAELEKGKWRTGGQAYAWLKKNFDISFHPNRIYQYLGKLGGRLKVPRPSHRKKDKQKVIEFKETFTQAIIDLDLPRERPVRFWIYDEMRYGLAPITRRMWTTKGKEIVAPVHKRYQWGYVFGALQIAGGGSEFLYSPTVSKHADACFLKQISERDPDAIHVVIGDGAGFHHRNENKNPDFKLPENIRIITLPPYSPELNPIEKLWDIVKDGICNQVFDTLKELETALDKELSKYWTNGKKVLSLLTNSYLPLKVNAISNSAITLI